MRSSVVGALLRCVKHFGLGHARRRLIGVAVPVAVSANRPNVLELGCVMPTSRSVLAILSLCVCFAATTIERPIFRECSVNCTVDLANIGIMCGKV